jgi:signal transduction histidine kinase
MTPAGFTAAVAFLNLVPAAACVIVATLIWWQARWTGMALGCAYVLTLFGTLVAGPIDALAFAPGPLLLLATMAAAVGQLTAPVFFFLFPSGDFRPRALRWVAGAGAVVLAGLLVPDVATGRAVTADAVQDVGVLLFLIGVIGQVLRYRAMRDARQRAQVRWVVYGLALATAVFTASRLLVLLLPPAMVRSEVAAALFGGGTVCIAMTIVPVCIGIAVLRGGLWDVDRVVNRTAVYGLLSVLVVTVYVIAAAVLGAQVHAPSLLTSLLATGVVVIVLQPLHRLVQRAVNRLMFGLRDEPTVVLTELARRLRDSADAETVLSTTAETVGRALKLPMVEVRLRDGTVVHWGATSGIATAEPLRAQGRDVGQLLLGERRPGESLTARDLELAAQVASQIAVAADSLLLTNDLRASRSRIVEAREDERRRLRRDLHDGLGPSLAGLALQASAISEVAQSDPDTAARLGGAVAAGIRGVIADVRRLVYGLRPPALDELGLLGGLRAAAQGLEVAGRFRIVVDAAEPLPALPASVEAAAYRIASEAMANAARHAEATVCRVRLRTDDVLLIDVEDDGTGIPEGTAAGVGLLGMRERAAEVGGVVEVRAGEQRGTLVRARLPLAVPAEEAA